MRKRWLIYFVCVPVALVILLLILLLLAPGTGNQGPFLYQRS